MDFTSDRGARARGAGRANRLGGAEILGAVARGAPVNHRKALAQNALKVLLWAERCSRSPYLDTIGIPRTL